MEPIYNIGQVVKARNTINSAEGRITAITRSTGSKEGYLYKVQGNHYFEEDIIAVRAEVTETPNHFYDKIHSLQNEMCENVYQLTKKFGKRTESKDGKNIKYVLSLKSKLRPCYCFHPRGYGKITIEKIEVFDSPEYHHGYISFVDNDNESYNENEIAREMFNIYSAVYHKVYK